MAFIETWRMHLIEHLGRSSGGHWENLVWRSGLCDWCRGCMQMHSAVSEFVRGTVKSLKWRLVLTKAQYSARCSSSLCLKPCHESSTPGSPGRTSICADDLVITTESLEECVRRLLTCKEAMEKKGLRVNAGKTRIMICCTGLDLLQSSGEFPCSVCHTGVGSNSIFCWSVQQQLQALGAQEMQWDQALNKGPWLQMYMVQGTACPLDGRPQKEVQVRPDKLEVVASFCYLGDML